MENLQQYVEQAEQVKDRLLAKTNGYASKQDVVDALAVKFPNLSQDQLHALNAMVDAQV